MVGIFIIYSRYAFHFFLILFVTVYSHFFSLSHRTCYLEGIVSLLLVWSVYSYVFFLSVLFVCCYSSPSSSKLHQKNRFANSIQLHLPTPSIPPTVPTHPFPLFQSNTTTQTKTKNRAKKGKEKRHNQVLILIPKNPPIRRWNIRITPKLHQIIIRRTPRNLRNQTIRIRHGQSIRKPTHRLTMHDSNRHILSGGKLPRNGQ